MSNIIQFNDGTYMTWSESNKETIYNHIRLMYNVNPELQVKIKDNKVCLTNKFGEVFAQVGEIK